jgi:Protein of unknown function (DUF2934)
MPGSFDGVELVRRVLQTDMTKHTPIIVGVVNVRGHRDGEISATKDANAVIPAADRSSKSLPDRSAQVTNSEIARRAYDLYLTRGCEHGHDVDDWLQAERDLRDPVSSTAA